MLGRRHLLLAVPGLALAACETPSGPPRAAHHGVTLVYVGADDCPPCRVWRKAELPKWEASALRAKVDFHMVMAARYAYVSDLYYWPPELRWIHDAAAITRGAPQYVVAQDGRVMLRGFGTPSWRKQVLPLLERLTATA